MMENCLDGECVENDGECVENDVMVISRNSGTLVWQSRMSECVSDIRLT